MNTLLDLFAEDPVVSRRVIDAYLNLVGKPTLAACSPEEREDISRLISDEIGPFPVCDGGVYSAPMLSAAFGMSPEGARDLTELIADGGATVSGLALREYLESVSVVEG